MRTVADYLVLVPPEHASKPKFMATLAMALQPFADQQQFFADLPSQFDLDTAIGHRAGDDKGIAVYTREMTVVLCLSLWIIQATHEEIAKLTYLACGADRKLPPMYDLVRLALCMEISAWMFGFDMNGFFVALLRERPRSRPQVVLVGPSLYNFRHRFT